MLNKLEIDHFRGIKHCSLDNIAPVTLLSGKNNAGKSTILEAIYFLTEHCSPEVFGDLNAIRGVQTGNNTTDVWKSIFYNLDPSVSIVMNGKSDSENYLFKVEKDDSYVVGDVSGISPEVRSAFRESSRSTYTLKFSFEENDYKENGHYISGNGILRQVITNLEDNEIKPVVKSIRLINNFFFRNDSHIPDLLSNAIQEGRKSEIVETLRIIDPDITDIELLSQSGLPQIYLRKGAHLIPASLAGDGVNKLLFFIISIMNLKDGILLIDEIDTGFHYSVFRNVWDVINKLSKAYHCQVIATTHSYECIRAFAQSDSNIDKEYGCYYRLERKKDDEVRAIEFDRNQLKTAVESSLEIR